MYQLLIEANNCEGNCVCVANNNCESDIHIVAFTIIGPYINNVAYVYTVHIKMYMKKCIWPLQLLDPINNCYICIYSP